MRREKGFTLIEVLITLVVVTVGIMALSKFTIAMMGSGQASRERLTAVHLAEQIMEEWQQTDTLPTLDTTYCQTAAAWATSTTATVAPCPTSETVTTSTANCTPSFAAKSSYTISTSQSIVCGPAKTAGSSMVFFKDATPYPVSKVVTVSWTRKGATRSIYLTHLTQVK